jgi:hypothetical protein
LFDNFSSRKKMKRKEKKKRDKGRKGSNVENLNSTPCTPENIESQMQRFSFLITVIRQLGGHCGVCARSIPHPLHQLSGCIGDGYPSTAAVRWISE